MIHLKAVVTDNMDGVFDKTCYLPDWASPGNWLSPEGHADLKNSVGLDDPSLCNLCSFPLKLFNDEAETMSSPNMFHLLTILPEQKCCLISVITMVITRFLCNFRECPLVYVLSLWLNSKNMLVQWISFTTCICDDPVKICWLSRLDSRQSVICGSAGAGAVDRTMRFY